MGVLEFESLVIIILMLVDIILGYINHVFIKEDNVSSIAVKSIGSKIAVVTVVIGMCLVLHLNDNGIFDTEVSDILDTYGIFAKSAVVFICYYELTSVCKHIQLMTGIDLSKYIKGLESEIKNRK